MLVLHDDETLLHWTVELLGAKIKDALDSPARINAILEALESSDHKIEKLAVVRNPHHVRTSVLLRNTMRETHDERYLHHLKTVHAEWVQKGYIEEHESVLPECFNFASPGIPNVMLNPPDDLFARPGFWAFDMSSGICKDSWLSIEASKS